MKKSSSNLIKKDDGSNIVELALLMPLLLLILIGAIDFGRAYYIAIEVNSAAHAAALYGSQNFTDINGITAAAKLDAADLFTPHLLDVSWQPLQITPGCECYDGSHSETNLTTCSTEADPCVSKENPNVGNLVYWIKVKTSTIYTPIIQIPGVIGPITLTGQSIMRAAY